MYRLGRVLGVAELHLRPSRRVLDVGCGTGLSLPLLCDIVGTAGRIVGVDASAAMLARARARTTGWGNVEFRRGDTGELAHVLGDCPPFDAVLFGYTLSIIAEWRRAFAQSLDALRSGGRVAVVDLALPTGPWRVLSPLARLACLTGGADPHRAPWQLVAATTADARHRVVRGGHVHVAAGTRV